MKYDFQVSGISSLDQVQMQEIQEVTEAEIQRIAQVRNLSQISLFRLKSCDFNFIECHFRIALNLE